VLLGCLMKKVIGYGLMGIGALLLVPAWCAMGQGTIYDATSYVPMPAWLLSIVGLGMVGLGHLVQGPSLAERRAKREADDAARRERLARHRRLAGTPEYQTLVQRRKELDEAADRADEAGEIDRRDALREESHKAWLALEALRRESK
jgi:hypothetical protein